MPVTMRHEGDNIYRLDVSGLLKKADLDRQQATLVPEIARAARGKVRLLVVLDQFAGWEPGAAWNDLAFYVKHGDDIERIAIVGDEQWRQHMLMFAAADLRRAPVEFFPPEAMDQARDWLTG